MRRIKWIVGPLVLSAMLALVWKADLLRPRAKAEDKGPPIATSLTEEYLLKANPWAGLPDPDKEITLSRILDEIAKNSKWRGVQFDIDERAFKADGIDDPAGVQIVPERGIEAGVMTLSRALKKILERVPAKSGATFLVRRDVIEITTTRAAREEIWGKDHPGPYLPLVHATFNGHTLIDALQALADQADRNILLDGRVGGRAQTIVAGRFRNLPLDTAVELLARNVDLDVVQVEGGLYVTSHAEAKAVAKRRRDNREAARAQREREQTERARREALKTCPPGSAPRDEALLDRLLALELALKTCPPRRAPREPAEDEVDRPLPVDIPQFELARRRVASGHPPFADGDGIDWLKSRDYKAVLHIRPPGEDTAGAKRLFEKKGLRYLSLGVSPATLTRDVVAQFHQLITDPKNLPLYVFDDDSAVLGGLWYLHFRLYDKLPDLRAYEEAQRLGFKITDDPAHRTMWVAARKLLRASKE
jgi:hypothetical protein